MNGLSCPNCGLTIGDRAYNVQNVLYCCRGCAERTYCFCRVSVSADLRKAFSAADRRGVGGREVGPRPRINEVTHQGRQ